MKFMGVRRVLYGNLKTGHPLIHVSWTWLKKIIHIHKLKMKMTNNFNFLWVILTHIWVSKLNIIGSDNVLLPGWCQAIIWTHNAGKLFIRPLGTNLSEFLMEIHTFSFSKRHVKMSSAEMHPFCLNLSVLIIGHHWPIGWHSLFSYFPCPTAVVSC